MSPYTLRPARPGDEAALVGLITELAEFESLTHLLQLTPDRATVLYADGRLSGRALKHEQFVAFKRFAELTGRCLDAISQRK